MSFWKERANERRERRQSKDPQKPDNRRMRKKRDKPFCVEMKSKPGEKNWFGWHEWSNYGRYTRLQDAKQAMANLKRHRLWGDYLPRIVDTRTGDVVEE